jgi:hypothetical protein
MAKRQDDFFLSLARQAVQQKSMSIVGHDAGSPLDVTTLGSQLDLT